MITWMRNALITHGKREEAIEWALKVATYLNESFNTSIVVHGNATGPVNQIYWIVTYDSMDEFEAMAAKIIPDEGYNELLAESEKANLFGLQTFKETLLRSIEEQ